MILAPRLARLVRYPVKGFAGQDIPRARVRQGGGLPFDRALAFGSGRLPAPEAGEWAPTRTFRTLTTTTEPMRSTVELDEVAGTVTLGHPLHGTLTIPLGAAGPVMAAGGSPQEWFTDGPAGLHRAAGGFWDDPEGTVSVVNLASVDAVAGAAGTAIDPLRFRANLYLEGLPPWAELELTGQRITVGEVQLEVVHPINRCSATSVNPATAVRDLNVPALLATHFGHVYCGLRARVVTSGTLRRGDRVTGTGRRVRPARADGGPEPSNWPRYARVCGRAEHGTGTVSLWLEDPLSGLRPEPMPGQHITLHTADKAGPLWRSYTVSAHASRRFLRVTVKKAGRMSGFLHSQVAPGDRILISGPRGSTVLDGDTGRPLLLASAGIGITQTLALLQGCAAARQPGSPAAGCCCATSPATGAISRCGPRPAS